MDWTRGPVIGHGSSATVSLATFIRSGDVFAAKSTELSKSEFLQREQKILSSLNSPHIITYKGCDITCENKKFMYNMFLEYAPHGTLHDEIHRNGGRLDESMIVCYTRQILLGMEYLHSKEGVAHCDIKSRNILVTKTGVKIADFGCARPESEAAPSCGTPMFMAPEVARGEHQGFASDIWAVGCTIIEMATGVSPWTDAGDPVTALYRIAYSSEVPEFPVNLSKQAKDFLSNCLRRDPKQRLEASQLLKHPFLKEFNSFTKQIQEHDSNYSPTCILDQGIWNSMEETEENLGNLIRSSSEISASERIRRLSCSQRPRWDSCKSWITIRKTINKIKAEDEKICGSVLDFINGSLEEQESFVSTIKISTQFSKDNIYVMPNSFNLPSSIS